MSNLAVWVSYPYNNDVLFQEDTPLNRDNCLASFQAIQKKIVMLGGRCHTHDIYLKEGIVPDIVLFLDIPQKNINILLGNWASKVKKWVLLQECEVVLPRNWDFRLHQQFDKVFTWNDELIDGIKYFKSNWTHKFPLHINHDISRKTKLCTLIAGNKAADHPLELYSKRIEAIRWFEGNHPEDFDLYGIGWDEYTFKGPRIIRGLNRSKTLKRILAPYYPSYQGAIGSKHEVLEKYKFSICYENARDISGYITEKIFDCFFTGCVPIYWGAGNITKHIPEDCFIDRRKYSNYEELYDYISTMNDTTYKKYLECVEEYLSSAQAHEFTIDSIVNSILSGINNG